MHSRMISIDDTDEITSRPSARASAPRADSPQAVIRAVQDMTCSQKRGLTHSTSAWNAPRIRMKINQARSTPP